MDDPSEQSFLELSAEVQPRLDALSARLGADPTSRREPEVQVEIMALAEQLERLSELCPVPAMAQVYLAGRDFLLAGVDGDDATVRDKARDIARGGLEAAALGQSVLGEDARVTALEDESLDFLRLIEPEPEG